ncbi:gliding motility-associated C-terminal domain-containing protein, partial [bacterium]|nr:gliding motility-associated C-terminal domain-containing protein [bacterium]
HLPESGHITITIFNTNGQKVKTLIDEERVSGIYQIVWDGCNERSNCVPSGIYYYIMKVKDFSKTMKAVFIK